MYPSTSNITEDDEEAPPPSRSLSYPPADEPANNHLYESKKSSEHNMSFASNNSGQGTYYSAGETTSYAQSQPVSCSVNPISLSPSSSHTAADAEKKDLAKLEKELITLSTAIQSYPARSPTWVMLHSHLERAREELDALQQDIEISPSHTPVQDMAEGPVTVTTTANVPAPSLMLAADEEDTSTNDDTPISSAQSPRTMSRSNEEDVSRDDTPRPSVRSPTRSDRPSESSDDRPPRSTSPEVWIQYPNHHVLDDENSLDNSLLTFDEWSQFGDNRPDPAGCTKYVTALVPITENSEVPPSEMDNDAVETGVVDALSEAIMEDNAKNNDDAKLPQVKNPKKFGRIFKRGKR